MTIELEGMRRTPDEIVEGVVADLRETGASPETIGFAKRLAKFVDGHLVYPTVEGARRGLVAVKKEAARLRDEQGHSFPDGASNKA